MELIKILHHFILVYACVCNYLQCQCHQKARCNQCQGHRKAARMILPIPTSSSFLYSEPLSTHGFHPHSNNTRSIITFFFKWEDFCRCSNCSKSSTYIIRQIPRNVQKLSMWILILIFLFFLRFSRWCFLLPSCVIILHSHIPVYLAVTIPNVLSLSKRFLIMETVDGWNNCKGRVCPGTSTTPGKDRRGSSK